MCYILHDTCYALHVKWLLISFACYVTYAKCYMLPISWNVGSMTGRGRELVEVCKKRKIGILCVQETKWTGKSARELGDGFKILYSGEKSSRNGVGVILSPAFKEKLVEVSRPSDRLIKLTLVIAEVIFNIVSACAPQCGETYTIKEVFFKDWEDMMTRVPRTEKIVAGADLNGHVGKNPGVLEEKAMAKGTNREGENIFESMESLDLALVNTFFNKKEKHLIT